MYAIPLVNAVLVKLFVRSDSNTSRAVCNAVI